MGPPSKIEEFSPRSRSSALGFTYWWSYYDDRLAIEFADEKGTGKYRITDYEGDFFSAMDLMQLGRSVRADDVFSKKFIKFEAAYDPINREIEVRIPSKALIFRENETGGLQVDLRFRIYIYEDEGVSKEVILDARSVVTTGAELEDKKTIGVKFARGLKPGTNFVDVIIQGPEKMKGQIRQIFEFKVAAKTL